LLRRIAVTDVRVVEANGHAAAVSLFGRQRLLLTIEVRDHAIHTIYGILNPDKLAFVERQLAQRS
jgi:hypothetical protein